MRTKMYNEGGMTDTAGEECFEMVQDGPGRPKRRKKKRCKQTFGKRGIPDVVKKIAKGAAGAGAAVLAYAKREPIKKLLGINQVGGSTKRTYKTGGMVNSNTKVQADKTPGSKGVMSKINTKVSASKKTKGRVGGTSSAPKKATPGRR